MPLSAAETMRRMRDTTFCVAPTGDSDGFTQVRADPCLKPTQHPLQAGGVTAHHSWSGPGPTQRFYYILASGCIPVRVDTYYSKLSFGRVAWPFKQTVQWKKAVVLLPPERLRRDGLIPYPTVGFSNPYKRRLQQRVSVSSAHPESSSPVV